MMRRLVIELDENTGLWKIVLELPFAQPFGTQSPKLENALGQLVAHTTRPFTLGDFQKRIEKILQV